MPLPVSNYVPQCAPGDRARRRALVAWGVVAGGALLLCGLVLLAPAVLARGYTTLSYVLYGAFHAVCHQIPERSFHVGEHALAVCARCTGIYAGVVLGALLYPLVTSLRNREAPARVWLFAAALPTAADFALGVSGVWENTHLSRSLTGALLGAAASFFIIPGAVDLSYTYLRGRGPKVESGRRRRRSQVFPLSLHRGINNR